jgi:dienelactone hydrolase
MIRRTAFYLESDGRPLLAWLHEPAAARPGRGVVFCPAIGCEQVHSYRSVRAACDAIAEGGSAALRFDYLGTGDSAGDETDWRFAAWVRNVYDAMGWLARHLGSERIDLVGLRLGATLALKVAEERQVERLVLWAPIAKGKRFVREMRMLSASMEGATDQVEAAGFLCVPEFLAELETIDATKLALRCSAAFLVGEETAPLRDRLRELGADVAEIPCPGYADMMTYPHYTKVPRETIAAIVSWLGSSDVGRVSRPVSLGVPAENRDSAVMTSRDGPGDAPSRDAVVERPMTIDTEPELFGILGEPAGGADSERPMIVLLNAGAVAHIGPNRLYVDVARRLAAEGFRTFRLDIQGLGDSPAADPSLENHVYPDTMFGDVERAMTWLRDRQGARKIVLLGLCSGAYAAFQEAAQSRNPDLVDAILLNPLTYHWHEGMSIDRASLRDLEVENYYTQAMLDPRKWRKLLTGRSRTGLVGAIKIGLRKLFVRPAPLPEMDGHARPTTDAEIPSHPPTSVVRSDLSRIRAAGRRVAFWFAPREAGHTMLLLEAKRLVRELVAAGTLSIDHIPGADHTFSNQAPRRLLIDKLVAHLASRYPERGPRGPFGRAGVVASAPAGSLSARSL